VIRHYCWFSATAGVTVGYSINGRNVWKNDEDKSMNDIEKDDVRKLLPLLVFSPTIIISAAI
jgi:hypothetical protein